MTRLFFCFLFSDVGPPPYSRLAMTLDRPGKSPAKRCPDESTNVTEMFCPQDDYYRRLPVIKRPNRWKRVVPTSTAAVIPISVRIRNPTNFPIEPTSNLKCRLLLKVETPLFVPSKKKLNVFAKHSINVTLPHCLPLCSQKKQHKRICHLLGRRKMFFDAKSLFCSTLISVVFERV